MFKDTKLLKLLPLIIAILTSLIIVPPTKSSLTQSRSIKASGTISYKHFSVHVNGRQVLDTQGNPIKLRGFNLWRVDVFKEYGMPLTLERFQQIKGWGFNIVNIAAFWGSDIEPFEDQPGVYDEENLQKIENVIKLAEQVELYVTLSLRIHYETEEKGIPTWQGWPTTEKLENYVDVQQRFYDMWSMMIQRFDSYDNVIGYNWWFFPWHEPPWGERVAEEVDFYYNEFVPNLLSVTRADTNKIIFFTPYKQASIRESGVLLDTGEFAHIEPIADDNVVYCHGWHKPYEVEWTNTIKYDEDGNRIPWDYDIDALRRQLQHGLEFMNQYNVPMMCTEMGMHTHNYPDVQQGTFYQDRLDCYEAKLSLLDEYGWNWVYLVYSNGAESSVLKAGTYDLYPIVDVLLNHIQ